MISRCFMVVFLCLALVSVGATEESQARWYNSLLESEVLCLNHETCQDNLIHDRCKLTDLSRPHCEPTVVPALVDAYLAQCGKPCTSSNDCRQALYCTECYLGECDNPAGLSLTEVVEKTFGAYPKPVVMPRDLPGDTALRKRIEEQQAELAAKKAERADRRKKRKSTTGTAKVDL
eukprot:CAMPEP_0174230508 /NCGR_PEP_ID=MMETSP0417-20130205/1246_1 /TAXON_ID=242541 /ORGANISM="Mayorella sp, Strain BSH-02190019" /LENGTH=175 /DNA_ID=CAMNT_0015308209 /DNA_START=109 /DNA_END=636 /DNA_ORIENTATION=+